MPNFDQYLRQVEEIIAREGHAVQYVYGSPGASARPFAYTVGLHTRPGHDYELAVSGLAESPSAVLLTTVTDILTRTGTAPIEGMEFEGVLLDGYKIRLRPASRPRQLGIIHALFGHTPPVWQVMWPDKDHIFPDDENGHTVAQAQPLL